MATFIHTYSHEHGSTVSCHIMLEGMSRHGECATRLSPVLSVSSSFQVLLCCPWIFLPRCTAAVYHEQAYKRIRKKVGFKLLAVERENDVL